MSPLYTPGKLVLRRTLGDSLKITRTPIYPEYTFTINTQIPTAGVTAFTLPSTGAALYDVDWGDGIIQTNQTSNSLLHTYASPGIYTIKVSTRVFKVYQPFFNNTGSRSQVTSVLAGTAPEFNFGTNLQAAWYGCPNITSFGVINTSTVTNFANTWQNCASITSFPLLDTSSGKNFTNTWNGCTFTSFPLIDTSSGTNFFQTWRNCLSLTSFPALDFSSTGILDSTWRGCNFTSFGLINTSGVQIFSSTWIGCNELTSFPLIDTSSGTNFNTAWSGCSGLTSFPAITVAGSCRTTWNGCSGLTSFPLISSAGVTDFFSAWNGCIGLTSFPLIDTSTVTLFQSTWQGCTGLTSFPALNFSSGNKFTDCWKGCTNLATFPANAFNTSPLLTPGMNGAFQNCALTALSIENILASLVTNGRTGRTINLDGGTNAGAATWTATANADYATLISRGWTIVRNP